MDLLNETVMWKEKSYTVVAQTDTKITLDSGTMIDYAVAFERGLLKVDSRLENAIRFELEQKKASENKINAPFLPIAVHNVLTNKGIGNNIAGINGNMQNGLSFGFEYGSNAKSLYCDGCNAFNWKMGKVTCFGFGFPLYAPDCTPESYAVWFLSYSNLTGKSGGNKVNMYKGDIIEEYYFGRIPQIVTGEPRVTFIKQKNDKYVFIGVYQLKSRESKPFLVDGVEISVDVRIYERVEETYGK